VLADFIKESYAFGLGGMSGFLQVTTRNRNGYPFNDNAEGKEMHLVFSREPLCPIDHQLL
jgi:hypothetical protein